MPVKQQPRVLRGDGFLTERLKLEAVDVELPGDSAIIETLIYNIGGLYQLWLKEEKKSRYCLRYC